MAEPNRAKVAGTPRITRSHVRAKWVEYIGKVMADPAMGTEHLADKIMESIDAAVAFALKQDAEKRAREEPDWPTGTVPTGIGII